MVGSFGNGCRLGKPALIAATIAIQLVLALPVGQCRAMQADNGSQDVSRRLDAATQHLQPVDQYSADEDEHWIVIRLVDLQLKNGQLKEAVEVAEQTTGELRAVLFTQVFGHGIEKASEILQQETVSSAERNLLLSDLRYVFGQATQWETMSSYRLYRQFDDLLECGELEFVKQVIAPLPEINPDYEFRNGSYGSYYYQMRLLAKLAGQHLRSGDDSAAHEIISRYQVEVTRDQARLIIVEQCLSEDRLNLQLARTMLDQFEGAGKRFWAAFRIGMYCVQNGMPDEAMELVDILNENYEDTDPRNRVYEAKLLICLAQLQYTRGAPYDSLLLKAVAISGNNREDRRHIACVRALAGELDAASKPANTAFRAIDRLLDIDNRNSTSYPPFYHVKPEDRIAAATQLAKHFGNVHVRAAALCKVANVLSGTDPAEAKLLVDLAWEAAISSDRMESISGFTPELIQPSWAFKNIAESYARCGWPLQALGAAERVSDEIDDSLTTRDGRTATHQQGAVKSLCQLIADTDRPFVEEQGREIFEFLRRLEAWDEWLGSHDTAS
ncbi:MAG: hypothetical protein ACR2NP_01950, partial [Pirellulaceae bacterium]